MCQTTPVRERPGHDAYIFARSPATDHFQVGHLTTVLSPEGSKQAAGVVARGDPRTAAHNLHAVLRESRRIIDPDAQPGLPGQSATGAASVRSPTRRCSSRPRRTGRRADHRRRLSGRWRGAARELVVVSRPMSEVTRRTSAVHGADDRAGRRGAIRARAVRIVARRWLLTRIRPAAARAAGLLVALRPPHVVTRPRLPVRRGGHRRMRGVAVTARGYVKLRLSAR